MEDVKLTPVTNMDGDISHRSRTNVHSPIDEFIGFNLATRKLFYNAKSPKLSRYVIKLLFNFFFPISLTIDNLYELNKVSDEPRLIKEDPHTSTHMDSK